MMKKMPNMYQIPLESEIHKNELEEDDNPLDNLRTASNETVMTSNIPMSVTEDTVTVAPGEGKKTFSVKNQFRY